MQSWYAAENLVDDGSSSATVSNVSLSEYLRPFEKNMTSGNLYRDGFVWFMAHYLEPLPIKQFQLTSSDRVTVEQSTLYQNPYWPLKADSPGRIVLKERKDRADQHCKLVGLLFLRS